MAVNLHIAINIEERTRDNEAFRAVFDTSDQMQLVFMSLLPGEDIGFEVHSQVTQFIRVEEGTGVAVLNNKEYLLDEKSAVFIQNMRRKYLLKTFRKNCPQLSIKCVQY